MKIITKKIVEYYKNILILIILLSLLITFLFIYNYVFSAYKNINEIYNLNNELGFKKINIEKIDKVYGELKIKTAPRENLRLSNSPF